jgi:hypothetical protein
MVAVPIFSPADIADAAEAGLRRCTEALDHEQSVRGIDALEEVALHAVLADAFAAAGFGVHREQRYPQDRRTRRESEGERCDFVLTPDARPLRATEARSTLFDRADAVDPEDALWLEMKVVAQHVEDGANGRYATELLSTVRRDVTKLSKDAGILRAMLLIVLFVADERVAEHDLGIWQDRCLRRGLPIGAPSRRTFAIADRIGNRVCAVAVYPVHHL